MVILYYIIGISLYAACEIFSVPNRKKKIKDQIYDYGIFAMQPLTGRKAVCLGTFAIYFLRVGIVIYILLGIYIFWW
ncbi:MAG: hypothetical protein DRQ58_09495 [Gammaproteobacteria bacterium]|nr:MAG: hypothetical protein DRQ58_09495 [Gammaproteobacteria bacterium]